MNAALAAPSANRSVYISTCGDKFNRLLRRAVDKAEELRQFGFYTCCRCHHLQRTASPCEECKSAELKYHPPERV